jgi:hypothetical protein
MPALLITPPIRVISDFITASLSHRLTASLHHQPQLFPSGHLLDPVLALAGRRARGGPFLVHQDDRVLDFFNAISADATAARPDYSATEIAR